MRSQFRGLPLVRVVVLGLLAGQPAPVAGATQEDVAAARLAIEDISNCWEGGKSCVRSIRLVGVIARGDDARVRQVVAGIEAGHEQHRPLFPYRWSVMVDSAGGDVTAAMAIGRLLRSKRAEVKVFPECLSSCVLILAGGSYRSVVGTVGIHRPYLADASGASPAELTALWKGIRPKLIAYFEEMSVSPSLADMMIATPPERMRALSEEELDELMLSQTNPADDEIEVARNAAIFGISSREYRRRDRLANEECAMDVNLFYSEDEGTAKRYRRAFVVCQDRHYWDLDEDTYRERAARATSSCSRTGSRSNWSGERFQECRRAIIGQGRPSYP